MVLVIVVNITKTLQPKRTNLKHKKLKAMKKLIVIAAVVLGFTTTTFAQNLTASANASATMVAALNVSKATGGDMNFGTIYTPSAASTLVLTAAASAVLTPSSGLQILSTTGGTAAHFTVSAGAGSPKVSWTAGPITLSNGTTTMSLSTLTCSNGTQGAPITLTGGSAEVYIGGTLNIGANQATGTYSNNNSVVLTVAY